MDDKIKSRDVLIEADRRLQETAQRLLSAKKEQESLLNEIDSKNLALNEALKKIRKQSIELMHSANMASLGVFAGGVAHELNNPLMAVLNFVQYCIKHTSSEEKIYKVLLDAEAETKRCVEVVKSVLTFSRLLEEGEENFEQINFLVILKRILELLDYRIERENVEIKLDFPGDSCMVLVKQNMIQRAILNIFLNALDAVGRTSVKKITVKGRYDNDYFVISITDTGCGIEEKNMLQLFDPFFTTKKAGESVGMGLPIAKQIVEGHHGKISCSSKVGVGTTFTILLPFKEIVIV